MDEHTRKGGPLPERRPGALGALIHDAVRRVIEVAVEEELTAALGAARYARDVGRGGYRNGHRSRTVTGRPGPLALTLPRATLSTAMDVPAPGEDSGQPADRGRGAGPPFRSRGQRPDPAAAPRWVAPHPGGPL